MQTYNFPHRKEQRRREALERRKKNLGEFKTPKYTATYSPEVIERKTKIALSDIANLEAKLGQKAA